MDIGRVASGKTELLVDPKKYGEKDAGGPELELRDNIIADLSSGQLLPYQLTRAVRTGNISAKEACKKIGPLNHARVHHRLVARPTLEELLVRQAPQRA
ncbi:hypothetical protein FJT64_025914 [Amphibalanus amphitrite]|uniref:Uncharacterized protein n=1 Tax=Amphibalanus amphitrite TaxID=1232801 RepID=A0A6A4WE83_AMPAM|nr:hypothetical protein FJT64_025914 [Amphibalanus amphitrite]